MSQCVPSWDLDESNKSSRIPFQADPNTNSTASAPVVDAMLDYEVAELTWENGQLSMHGLGLPRPAVKPLTTSGKCPWDKPRVGGTLESIVDQATCLPPSKGDELVPWFAHHRAAPVAAAMDALVPCSKRRSSGQDSSTRVVGSSTRVGSCSVAAKEETSAAAAARKRMKVAGEGSSREQSESRHVTMDTYEMDLDAGFSSSLGSHEHTSRGQPLSSRTKPTTVEDHDSVCHSRPQREAASGDEKNGKMGRSSTSSKRSRAAAIHNQSERKRRDRINQRMKTLQKLVPNSSKTDKASMLDEVIEYLKQLQAQIQMMSKMNSIPHMMMPMAMQQLQMSMMAQMGMGMGMGMGVMDLSCINRTGHATTPVPPMLHPAAFLPLTAAAWDGSGDRLQPAAGVMPDPFSPSFLACQTQPMNLDAYNRMAALYQQLQQSSGLTPPNSKT